MESALNKSASPEGPLVIFHAHCVDGFTAAWVAHIALGDVATYLPAQHGQPPPDVHGRDVYILDFSYPREDLLRMKDQAKSLLVLDHHATVERALADLDFCHFDMNKSGAWLTLDHFFPHRLSARLSKRWESAGDVEFDLSWPEWLVAYTEDRDLWKWALPESKTVNAYIGCCDMTFDSWTTMGLIGARQCAELGAVVEQEANRYVSFLRQNSYRVRFDVHDNIPCVNAPYWRISELLNALAAEALFAVGWSRGNDGLYHFSLRSHDFDVGTLATKYGGGGHQKAAGFVCDHPIFVTEKVQST